MTRYDILAKIGMWLKDEYKIVCVVDYKNETIRVEFHLLKNIYFVAINPLCRWYKVERDNFSESDFNYLYNYCCRIVEREWVKVLKNEFN